VRKFNKNIFYGVPLSSQIKEKNRYYISISFQDKKISALISQMKLIDAKRLHVKMGKLSGSSFTKTKNSIKELF